MPVKSRTLAGTMEETKDRHRRYMRAIQHPVRRDILRAMERGLATLEEFEEELPKIGIYIPQYTFSSIRFRLEKVL